MPHLTECLLILGRSAFQTLTARLLARWWGVEQGRGCRFYGIPVFRRLPGSRIRLGEVCEFRSAVWSNLVGLNRPCMLSTLAPGAEIEIGSGCGFSATVLGCANRIILGNRVMCGANVTITDTDWHPLNWRSRMRGEPGAAAPVVIGDDVWLGMNVTVLKGVEIGPRTVVAAGSTVSRSLPGDVIAAGSPAVPVRHLTEDDRIAVARKGVVL